MLQKVEVLPLASFFTKLDSKGIDHTVTNWYSKVNFTPIRNTSNGYILVKDV